VEVTVVPLAYESVTVTCTDAPGASDPEVTVQNGLTPRVPVLLTAVTPAGNPERSNCNGPVIVAPLLFFMVNVSVPCFSTLL
jgi:hypothetical protein